MPTYFAGRVNGLTGSINTGSEVVAARTGTGSYMLTLPAVASNRFLMTVVTPSANNPPVADTHPIFARVTSTTRSATNPKTTTVLVMLFDNTGAAADCDFEFIAVERTGS
jgi:hypothetical protein